VSGFIQRVSLKRGKFGPAPRFAPEDAARALLLLHKRMGRARLARHLGVGEGTMRTIITHLSGRGLVESAPMGVKLTAAGARCVSLIRGKAVKIEETGESRLTFGFPSTAALLRGAGCGPDSVSLRDELVRSGAKGGVLLKFESGRLVIPPYSARAQHDYASELLAFSSRFRPREGDLLVICFGGDRATRERAVLRACSLFRI
jgi:hypothetical protein